MLHAAASRPPRLQSIAVRRAHGSSLVQLPALYRGGGGLISMDRVTRASVQCGRRREGGGGRKCTGGGTPALTGCRCIIFSSLFLSYFLSLTYGPTGEAAGGIDRRAVVFGTGVVTHADVLLRSFSTERWRLYACRALPLRASNAAPSIGPCLAFCGASASTARWNKAGTWPPSTGVVGQLARGRNRHSMASRRSALREDWAMDLCPIRTTSLQDLWKRRWASSPPSIPCGARGGHGAAMVGIHDRTDGTGPPSGCADISTAGLQSAIQAPIYPPAVKLGVPQASRHSALPAQH